MNEKVDNALNRLHGILPLKKRQANCSEEIKQLHQQILHSFVSKGRMLTKEEMAQQVSNLDEAIDVLRCNDMVTFSDAGEPIGAYPFTMEKREHTVKVNSFQVHAMCALDALAIAPMFNIKTEIHSRCHVTATPIHIQQLSQKIENVDKAGGIYLGIAWGAADNAVCCADSLCMEMIFLQDDSIAEEWLAVDPENREIFTLLESVAFAERFFAPLIQ